MVFNSEALTLSVRFLSLLQMAGTQQAHMRIIVVFLENQVWALWIVGQW